MRLCLPKANVKNPRPGFGGKQPGAGRKPFDVPTQRHIIRVTDEQWEEFERSGGSPWLQGLLNLRIREGVAGGAKQD